MDADLDHRLRPRRQLCPPTVAPYASPSNIEQDANQVDAYCCIASQLLTLPVGWVMRLVSIQVEHVTSAFLTLISPFLYLYFHLRALPFRVACAAVALAHRLVVGLLGALYAFAALVVVMVVSVLLGVWLVGRCVEDPVMLRQPLHLNYSEVQPSAVVGLTRGGGRALLVGHTVEASLVLVLPESKYNRWIGVFQVQAEAISSAGDVLAVSSQPCMLRFRSRPVRLIRAFLLGIPLSLGMCSESQQVAIDLMRYRETRRRSTEMIKVRLKPRAGTTDLPQLYEAELLLKTQLPWSKELVYNWKWTLHVWASLLVYIVLLILLACCVKFCSGSWRVASYSEANKKVKEKNCRTGAEVSEALRRWGERSKRKPPRECHGPEIIESSASSVAGGEEPSEVIDDPGDFAASESSEASSAELNYRFQHSTADNGKFEDRRRFWFRKRIFIKCDVGKTMISERQFTTQRRPEDFLHAGNGEVVGGAEREVDGHVAVSE